MQNVSLFFFKCLIFLLQKVFGSLSLVKKTGIVDIKQHLKNQQTPPVELFDRRGRLSRSSGSSFQPTGSVSLHDGGNWNRFLMHSDRLPQSHLPFLTGVGPYV